MKLESLGGLRPAVPHDDPGSRGDAQLLELAELRSAASSSAALTPARNPLLDIKATVRVCVGEASMAVGELLGAQLDQVLPLNRQVDDLVDILLEGRVVARGRLVAVGDYFGVQLVELPLNKSA